MNRREILTRATLAVSTLALPLSRLASSPPAATLEQRALIPAGTRLMTFDPGCAPIGYIGWVEELQSGVGNTVGWLTETGIYKTAQQMVDEGFFR